MRTKIVSIGNSRGIRIPKILLEESGVETEVEIFISRDGLKIRPIKTIKKVITETALLSETVLKKDWSRPEEDVAWDDL